MRIRELEATAIAMREALELARLEADDRLQASSAQASAEAEQLRTAIAALRQELEAQEQRHAEALQQQTQRAADEVAQLQATVRALRDQLEETAMTDTASTDAVFSEQLEQLRQLQMLASLSRRVAALDSLDAVIDTLLQAAVQEVSADRGSIFLHDAETCELYTYVSTGLGSRQIRMMDDLGIAGAVFHSGAGEIVHDAEADSRFHRDVDEQTGYRTRSLVCAPIRNAKGETIGIAEMLNKVDGPFEPSDLALLEGMTSQCALTLEALQRIERTTRERQREVDFLNLVSDLTSELELTTLLARVVSEASRLLNCERTTLFLNDEKTNDLFSYVVDQLELTELRFPNHVGIAGTTFTSGQSIRIPYAYADLRFNPDFDRRTGYFTRCILCVPIFNKEGKTIGVTQSLNKRGGPFTAEDESRLRAFTAQIASALENAKLFSDVQAMKNYNAAMLESMSNGVITFDEEGRASTCNAAGSRILRRTEAELVGRLPEEVFGGNEWLIERIRHVAQARTTDLAMDAELAIDEETVSANVTVLPLLSSDEAQLGTLVMIEDISNEKRVKSTLARYMDPDLADRLLAAGSEEEVLGGNESVATVLFSDIRNFTTLAEQIGAQATVTLLNDYFARMVDCISQQGGMLDKFIGDAIMAVFGVPVPGEDDEDRALRAAIAMISGLWDWNREREQRGGAHAGHGRRAQHRRCRRRQHRQPEADGLHDHRRRRQPRLTPGGPLQALRRPDPLLRAHPRQAERRLPRARDRQGDREGQEQGGRDLRVPRLPRCGLLPEPDGGGGRVQRRARAVPGGRFRAGPGLVRASAAGEPRRQGRGSLPEPIPGMGGEPAAARLGRHLGDGPEVTALAFDGERAR